MAWPLNSSKKGISPVLMSRKGSGALPNHLIPMRLSYAEDALRIFSLPEGNYLDFDLSEVHRNLGLLN